MKYNVPNACNDCHADKSYQWSEDWIKKYYGERKKFTYASVLADGYLQKENADTSLIRLIENDLYPEMVRATALSYLSAYNSPACDSVIIEMLYNIEPLVRERAIDALNTSSAEKLVTVIFPLLDDPVKLVRISAASKLSSLAKEYFTEEQFKKLNEVLDEYLQTLTYLLLTQAVECSRTTARAVDRWLAIVIDRATAADTCIQRFHCTNSCIA